MSWLLEFFTSAALWVLWNRLSPPPGLGEVDEKDVYSTFGPVERIESTTGTEDAMDEEYSIKGGSNDGEERRGVDV